MADSIADITMHTAGTPVLLLTQDDFLWQHWRALDAQHWLPARGQGLADLNRWRDQDRTLAVIDAGLPGLPDWQSSEAWRAQLSKLHVIVASVRPSDAEGMRAMLCGARGYCHAYAPAATWGQVLHAVASGSVWMGASLVARLLRQVDAVMAGAAKASTEPASRPVAHWYDDALTERECAIARRVARGEANSTIAAALGISERTVKAHLTAIYDKLGVTDRLQLALRVHGLAAVKHTA